MRYTRNRQVMKARKQSRKMGVNIPIVKTGEIKAVWDRLHHLDPTFKWHREHDYGENYIEFGDYCLKARLKYSK